MANQLKESEIREIFEEMDIYTQTRVLGRHYSFSKQLEKKIKSYLDIKNLDKMTWEDSSVIEKMFAQVLGENMAQAFFEDNAHSEKTFKKSIDGDSLPFSPVWAPALKEFGAMGSLIKPHVFEQALNRFLEKTSNAFLAWHEGYEKTPVDLANSTQDYLNNQKIKNNPVKEDILNSILNHIALGLTPEAKQTHFQVLQARFEMTYKKPFNAPEENKEMSAKQWIIQKIQKMTDLASGKDVSVDSQDRKKPH